MSLLVKNFATIEARTNGTLEALKQAIVTISEDIDVHEDSLSQVGVSLDSPGNVGLPSVWKGLEGQIKGRSDLKEKLKEELTRVSTAKVELSDDLKGRVNSVYDVVMGRRGVKAYLDNDIGPGIAQLRQLYYLVTALSM